MGLCGELVLRDAVVVGVGLCFCNGLGGEERDRVGARLSGIWAVIF